MDVPAQQAVRMVRIMKWCFILSAALFIFVAVRIPTPEEHAPNSTFEFAISIAALGCVVAGFLLPKLLSSSTATSMQRTPASTPVKRWFSGCVVSLACFNACSLFAFALHFVGARVRIVELLFAIGMLSVIFWSPGNPPSANEGNPIQS